MQAPFSVARLPRIEFGCGTIRKLPDIVAGFGRRALLVTGRRAFVESQPGAALLAAFAGRGISVERAGVSGEPSPGLVDETVDALRNTGIDVVVAVGGGSVLDAAKAIAGMLKPGNSVMDHLEGVGPELPYAGPATPFIAVPTTAGTGSEATKNAVLSVQGQDGFKKSFRDEKLVAEYAVIDPDLLASCPPELVAANGMDAATQLLESLVSTRASVFTDALAVSGLTAVRDGLIAWYEGGPDAAEARERMAWAALASGITLAQSGLGSVHGLASPLGAFFPIPHGVVCGTLAAAATRVNIEAMEARDPHNPALEKYALAGRLFRRWSHFEDVGARVFLVHTLNEWTDTMRLPRLSAYRIGRDDIPRIVAHCRGSSMKTNPVVLTDEEVAGVLEARL